ncbi:MAG: endonuclease/exonuclease/phosphatase family protein [Bradymonadia bacterium]
MGKWLTVILMVIAWGCADEDAKTEVPEEVTIGTFNAGLARGYVDHAALRVDVQLDSLKAVSQIDVLCLQEVWEPSDRSRFIEVLSDSFPFSHFESTTNDVLFADVEPQPAACNSDEANPLAECAKPLCEGDPDIATCVLSNCGELFQAMSEACQGCAAANIGLGDIDAILDTCLMEGQVGYTYDGQNGLLMLSTQPIESKSFHQFDSFLTSRGVLSGRTHGVDVYCTHLTSRLSNPAYSGAYSSYAEENAAQIDALLDVVGSASSEGVVALAGDFNTGPMVGELSGELEDNFNKLVSDGWWNQNTESDMPVCTWCSENLITGGAADEAIDHVFVKGAEPSRVMRFFDEPIELQDAEGNTFMSSYSDHFGLLVSIPKPE